MSALPLKADIRQSSDLMSLESSIRLPAAADKAHHIFREDNQNTT